MRTIVIAGILLSMNVSVFSQKGDSVRLKEQLHEIERIHAVKFSYLEELIADQFLLEVGAGIIALDSVILLLEGRTKLKFEQVDDGQYIVVRDFKDTDRVTIYGKVVNEKGMPIEDALIQANGTSGAITDKNGLFRIANLAYAEIVTISHLGFDKKVFSASKLLSPEYKTISLKSNLSFIGEYVLEDYSLGGITKVQNKLIFNPEQLKLVPGWVEPDIMQAIQLSPGVSTPFESSSNLYIRGSSPDQNLVLWNGIKTYDQSHFFGAISAFNPIVPQSVEFIKSGAEPAYGDRVAGVIDIKTNSELSDNVYGSAGLSMLSGDVYMEGPVVKEKLAVSFSARRSYSDIVETPTYTQFAKRAFQNTKILLQDTTDGDSRDNQFFFDDLSASILFEPNDKQSFRFNTMLTENELDFRSRSSTTSYHDFLNTGSEGFNLNWSSKFSDRNSFSVEPYYLTYGLFYRFTTESGGITTFSSKNNLIYEKGVKTLFTLGKGEIQTSTFGYQYSDNRIQYAFNQRSDGISALLDNGDETLHSHAIFGNHSMRWNAMSFDIGTRLNYFNTWDKVYIEPRVKASYSFPHLSFAGTYEYRIQTVSQIKESVVSDLSLENQVWTLSSPEGFPIITSNQFSGSVAIDISDWIFEAEFYNRSLDGITSLTFGFLNPNPTDNEYRVGTSLIRGLDVFLQRKFENYSAVLSYSYINTENRFTGLFNDEPFPGNWNIRHLLKFNQFYKWRSFDFSLGWVWHSGKVFTESSAVSENGETVDIDFDKINKSILPKYHRMDLSASYKISTSSNLQYRIGLSILNLYNRRNLINRELRKEPTLNVQLLETEFFGLEFAPNLVFRVLW